VAPVRGRLIRVESPPGIPPEKTRNTTIGDGAETERPEDRVSRKFAATGCRTNCG